MAKEPNIPHHDYYRGELHFKAPREAMSRGFIDPDLIPGFDITGPIQDTRPFSTPTTAKIGTIHTLTSGTYSAQGGGVVTVVTSEFRLDGLPVTNPYTPLPADDGKLFTIFEFATEVGGTVDGEQTTNITVGTITYEAPALVSPIPDNYFIEDTGIRAYDVSSYFSGDDLTFSIAASPYVDIGELTGIVTVNTADMNVPGEDLTPIASNSGGRTQDTYFQGITVAEDAPIITSLVIETNGDISFVTNESEGTAYVIFGDDPNPTIEDVFNGVGDVAANWPITVAGGNSGDIDLTSIEGQSKQCSVMHVVILPSNILTGPVEVEATLKPPVSGGNLVNQTWEEDSGTHTYDTSFDFTGLIDSYSISPVITGVTIDNAGVVSWNTDIMDVQADTLMSVTASNSAGDSTPSEFNFDITPHITFVSPSDLFLSGEDGFYFELTNAATVWQDGAQTTPVTVPGNPVGFAEDQSPNGHDASQFSAGNRFLNWNSVGGCLINRSATNSHLEIVIPAGGLVGTMIVCTTEGSYVAQVDLDQGTWFWGGVDYPITSISGRITGICMVDRVLTAQEISDTIGWYVTRGAAESYNSLVGSALAFFFTNAEIVDLETFSLSAGCTNVGSMLRGLPKLKSVDMTGWDLSGLVGPSSSIVRDNPCEVLIGAEATMASTAVDTNFPSGFRDLALNVQSVNDVLVGLDSGRSENVSGFIIDISGGTSAAPTGAGATAKSSLEGKGWTVTTN